ncbi:MAG: DeoR/GlpR family DNA-binding transcription regulator [Planctomycetota bacterium]
MIAEKRRRRLLQALKQQEVLPVASASKLLQVSRMTVRRDLDMLAAEGLLRKVRGGAAPIRLRPADLESARPFTERIPVNTPAKELIARHVVKLLGDAHKLALDASSTVFCLAAVLKPAAGGHGPFVVTNSVPLFQELLRRQAGFRVALTGGEPHPRSGSLVGPLAIRSLEGLHFDYAVISVAGLMEETGLLYDSAAEDAAVKLALLARADKAILAVDKTKVNFLAPHPLGDLSAFDWLVTEEGVREVRKKEKTKQQK